MDEYKVFLALSRELTGIAELSAMVAPSLLDTMARDYLHRLREQFGADFVALLTLYDSLTGQPDPLAALLAHPDFKDTTESMAKQVVNVWLFSQIRVESPGKTGDDAPALDAGYFEKGFIWPAIHAHPLGFSHSRPGYWTTDPTKPKA